MDYCGTQTVHDDGIRFSDIYRTEMQVNETVQVRKLINFKDSCGILSDVEIGTKQWRKEGLERLKPLTDSSVAI